MTRFKSQLFPGQDSLILCAGKNEEHIELMHLHENNIRVAQYLTELPERKLLEQKLQLAIERAHSRILHNQQLQNEDDD